MDGEGSVGCSLICAIWLVSDAEEVAAAVVVVAVGVVAEEEEKEDEDEEEDEEKVLVAAAAAEGRLKSDRMFLLRKKVSTLREWAVRNPSAFPRTSRRARALTSSGSRCSE